MTRGACTDLPPQPRHGGPGPLAGTRAARPAGRASGTKWGRDGGTSTGLSSAATAPRNGAGARPGRRWWGPSPARPFRCGVLFARAADGGGTAPYASHCSERGWWVRGERSCRGPLCGVGGDGGWPILLLPGPSIPACRSVGPGAGGGCAGRSQAVAPEGWGGMAAAGSARVTSCAGRSLVWASRWCVGVFLSSAGGLWKPHEQKGYG